MILAVFGALMRAALGFILGALLLFLLGTPPAEWLDRAAPALAVLTGFPEMLEPEPSMASLRLLAGGGLLGLPLAALLVRLPGFGHPAFAALALAVPAWVLALQLVIVWPRGPALAYAGMAWTAALAYALPWRTGAARPLLAVLRQAQAGMAALLAVQLPLELLCGTGGLAATLVQAKHWRRPDESLAVLLAWLALALAVGLAARLAGLALDPPAHRAAQARP